MSFFYRSPSCFIIMNRKISILLGVAFSAVFLGLAARSVDISAFKGVYAKINPFEIVCIAAVMVGEIFLRGVRWKLLLIPACRAKLSDTFRLETIGLALNNVLPLRLGEVGRATLGGQIMGMPFLTCLSSIMVERALDVFSLFMVFMIVSRGSTEGWAADYRVLAWILLAAVFFGILFMVFSDYIIKKSPTAASLLEKFPKAGKVTRQLAAGAGALRNWKTAAAILILGFSIWFIDAYVYYFTGRVIGIDPWINYRQALTLLCFAAASGIMPAVPGYFGTYEYAMVKVLNGWGISETIGMAYAGFLHITMYIVVTGLGVIFLYQTGHSLSGVWNSLKNRR